MNARKREVVARGSFFGSGAQEDGDKFAGEAVTTPAQSKGCEKKRKLNFYF
jgi:hypothetical protein